MTFTVPRLSYVLLTLPDFLTLSVDYVLLLILALLLKTEGHNYTSKEHTISTKPLRKKHLTAMCFHRHDETTERHNKKSENQFILERLTSICTYYMHII